MIENEEYVHQMKKLISDTLNKRFNENILDDQVKWEYLKYNIIKYIVNFSKKLLKSTNRITAGLETKLKHFKNIAKTMFITNYKVCKQQLDAIYEEKVNDIKNRSKCNWDELGKKFSLNLEKYCSIQIQIDSVIINQNEITNQDEINKQTFLYQSLLPSV